MLSIFNYENSEIRVFIDEHGEPWWVAKDVCEVLDVANYRDAIARLDEDEKGVVLTDTPGGQQEMATINEPGLYALVLSSRKPEAKAFKRWVIHEVIPAIRKTGGFQLESISRKQLALMVVEAETEREKLAMIAETQQREIKIMTPKAEVYDQFIAAGNTINIGVFAKMISRGPNKFFEELRQMGILFKKGTSNLPYQPLIEAGYFQVKLKPVVINDQAQNIPVTMITPKGQHWLYNKLQENGQSLAMTVLPHLNAS